MSKKGITLDEFLSKFVTTEKGCEIWQGYINKKCNYGYVWMKGRLWLVHRLMWRLKKGKIPIGLEVCHTCDNPPCGNIEHLFLGTHLENMQDMIRKGRGSRSRNIGERNPMVKLSYDSVCMIRELGNSRGLSQKEIGKRFDVSQTTVSEIVNGKIWVK